MQPIDSKASSSSILLGLLILICLACDFLMVPVLTLAQGPPRIPAFPIWQGTVGCVLAQGCLLAAWLAWSDQPFWQRLVRHWTVAAILYLVWAAGLALGQLNQFAQASSFVVLSVPLVSIAAQTPLWFVRQAFGWRLIRGDGTSDTGPTPLSIRDLMMATVLVAVALALARLAPSPDAKEIGMVWIAFFIVASTISAITMLPASALLLRTITFQCGILLACLYASLWAALPWGVVLVAWHRGLFSPPPMAMLVGANCLIFSFAATVILAAAVARSRGYRLVRGRSRRQSGDF